MPVETGRAPKHRPTEAEALGSLAGAHEAAELVRWEDRPDTRPPPPFVRSKAAASRKRKSRPPPLSLNSPLLSTLATTVSQEIKHVKQLTHPFFSSAASTSCSRGLQSHPVPPPQKQRIKPLRTPSAHPSRFHLAPNVTRTDTRMLRSRAPPLHPSCFRCQREPTGEVIRLSGSEGRGASFQQAASCGNPVPRRSLPRCLLLPRCAHLGMSILRGGAAGVPVPGLRVTRGSKEPKGRFGQVPPLWLRSIGLLRKGSTLLSYRLVSQPSLSALLEALRTVGAQRLPDHIAGLPGVFRLGDPCGPEGGVEGGKNTQSS